MLPCGRPQRGGGTRVGAPPPGKLRILPRYMGGFFATCSPYVGTFFSFWGHYPPFGSLSVTFFSMGSLSASFSTMWGPFHIYFPGRRGGFFVFMEAHSFTKTSEGALQGRPQDLRGGGQEIFFSDLEICMSRSDMLRMAKPCA